MTRALLALLVLGWAAEAGAVYQCGNVTDDCQCGMNNPYPCCDNGGNCTWYAWEAACCAWGNGLPGWGNANQWSGNAAANASYQVLSYPVENAVSCRASGQYGHVAFVTALNGGGSITVHEENCWGNYGMDTATYQASFFTGGFIVRAGQVACQPGDTQTQSCGACGSQSRGCTNAGAWDGWGACSGEGACTPGDAQTQACGDCGSQQRTCSASCQWQDWGACSGPDPVDAGACDAGLPGPCGAGELRCVAGSLQCQQVVQPAREVCDGIDNDCNGLVDDGPGLCPVDAGPPDAGLHAAPADGGAAHADAGPAGRPVIHARGGCSASGVQPALLALAAALTGLRRRRPGC